MVPGSPVEPATPQGAAVPAIPGRQSPGTPQGTAVPSSPGRLPGSEGGPGGTSASAIAGLPSASVGSLPPVQLPLLSDCGGATLDSSASQVAASWAEPSQEEEDLFASEGEETGAPGQQVSGQPPREEDDFDEKDLFGSDDDVDVKELFGSEDEGPGSSVHWIQSAQESSELDEREIFGDMSEIEEKKAKVEDVILRRRPAPSHDRTFKSLRLPNVLSVEKSAFNRNNITQSMLEGYKEFKNTQDQNVVKLLNPENCVRWRFKKGSDGQNQTDDDGRPQYESNARIVEWEDGTRTLYVGQESFNVSEIEEQVVLFEQNSRNIHVCHGNVRKQLVVTPRNLQSASHESLKKSQFRKYQPQRRSLLLSVDESTQSKELYEQKQRRIVEPGPGEITAAFLEEDQPEAALGPSVLDIKKAAKRQRFA